ncbi:MAG: hypothetical protein QOI98_2002 [Solirubrobacteraceae bacterium]|jgi:hypothetical protein|nr:hypothetical protein [Solirubrobacteraceae bacterium]
MPVDRGRRIGAAAGILFALITIAGFLIPGSPPKADHLNNEFTQFLTDKRGKIMTSDALIGLGFAFYLLFLGALRSHLADRPASAATAGEDRTLSNAAVIGGSIGAALILAAVAAVNGIAFKAAGAGDDALNRAVFDVSQDLFAISGFAFAVFFASAGLVAAANGALPRALALLGVLVGVLNLVGTIALFAKSGFFANGGAFGFVVGFSSTLWVLAAAVFIFRGAAIPALPAGGTRIADRPAA